MAVSMLVNDHWSFLDLAKTSDDKCLRDFKVWTSLARSCNVGLFFMQRNRKATSPEKDPGTLPNWLLPSFRLCSCVKASTIDATIVFSCIFSKESDISLPRVSACGRSFCTCRSA